MRDSIGLEIADPVKLRPAEAKGPVRLAAALYFQNVAQSVHCARRRHRTFRHSQNAHRMPVFALFLLP